MLTSELDFVQNQSKVHCTQDDENNQHEYRSEGHYFRLEASLEDKWTDTLKLSYKEATFQTHFLFLSQVQNCTIFCQKTCLLSK